MRSKIKAFTILEVLINILITSIIIGMVYFIFNSYIQQLNLYVSDMGNRNRIDRFLLQMKTDFFEAEKIVHTGDGSFKAVFYDTRSIDYKILEKSLIREQIGIKDTLDIFSISLNILENFRTDEKLIREIGLQLNLLGESHKYVVTKEYPSILKPNNGDEGNRYNGFHERAPS